MVVDDSVRPYFPQRLDELVAGPVFACLGIRVEEFRQILEFLHTHFLVMKDFLAKGYQGLNVVY